MIPTRREAARVDEFVAVIRASAHPNHRPIAVDDTVTLPAVVLTSTPLHAETEPPALVDRLPLWALVALFVAVFAPVVVLFGIDAGSAVSPATPAPVYLDTTDRVLEVGAGRVTR
jgi:hypothetical protein